MVTAAREYQEPLRLREGLRVGLFLAGLVTLGSLQAYWLKPLIQSLSGNALFFGSRPLCWQCPGKPPCRPAVVPVQPTHAER
ncbi:MAG: hypothetical protein HY674_13090 [Chloroflexi bacterium]|nr:hypothetical protein [Chloroflexota bacterium]